MFDVGYWLSVPWLPFINACYSLSLRAFYAFTCLALLDSVGCYDLKDPPMRRFAPAPGC